MGRVVVCQLRPAGFGRSKHLTRSSLKSYEGNNKQLLTCPLLRYNKHNI